MQRFNETHLTHWHGSLGFFRFPSAPSLYPLLAVRVLHVCIFMKRSKRKVATTKSGLSPFFAFVRRSKLSCSDFYDMPHNIAIIKILIMLQQLFFPLTIQLWSDRLSLGRAFCVCVLFRSLSALGRERIKASRRMNRLSVFSAQPAANECREKIAISGMIQNGALKSHRRYRRWWMRCRRHWSTKKRSFLGV